MPAHVNPGGRSGLWIVGAVAGAGAVLAVAAFGLLPGGSTTAEDAPESPSPSASPPVIEDTVVALPSPEPPQPVTFTVAVAGDVLPHGSVVRSATTADGYDFTRLMEPVAPYIAGADLAICHMEVPVAPEGTSPSGYPVFSAPKELVRDLAATGWDGCSTASNHSVDKGGAGVDATLVAFDEARLGATGTARTEDEAVAQFYNVRVGTDMVTVADISFSYGTNGLPLPSGEPWAVNLFDADAADAGPIIEAAEQARRDGADVVIASVHCCVEYRTEPSSAQRSVAEQVAESGTVDLYVGHHAHVPQPIELLQGGPSGAGMWTLFGLGNFVSNQDSECCVRQTSNGLLATATFTVDPDGAVAVGVDWTAITVDRFGGHTVYPLAEIQGGAGDISATQAEQRYADVREAVGEDAPERTAPPEPQVDGLYLVKRG